MQAGWAHFEHGADIGLRGFGPSLEAAFEQAGRALTAVLADPDDVAAERTVPIACAAPDAELLLVDWLNRLIFEMATREMLFSRFTVRLDGTRLEGEAVGEALDRTRHAPAVEVKGATLTELAVRQGEDGGWLVQCVVDV